MPDSPAGLGAAEGDVLLMVGTTKDAFLLRSRPDDRADAAAWKADGPSRRGRLRARARPASGPPQAVGRTGKRTLLRDGLPPVVCVKAAVVGAV